MAKRERKVTDVPCAYCGVVPGEPCVSENGLRAKPHSVRVIESIESRIQPSRKKSRVTAKQNDELELCCVDCFRPIKDPVQRCTVEDDVCQYAGNTIARFARHHIDATLTHAREVVARFERDGSYHSVDVDNFMSELRTALGIED